MKALLNRWWTVGLVSSVMGLAGFAPVNSQPANDDLPAAGTTKTSKTRVAAKGTPRKTITRPATGTTARAGAARPSRATGKARVPAIFYDKEWSYRTATLYGKDKNIVSSVSGEAKFDRNGKYRQDYYIGSIGNFYKGTYKIQGDRLITYDEKGKKVFDFKWTVGTNPPILVLTLFEKDGSKSIDYSLVPLEKKKP